MADYIDSIRKPRKTLVENGGALFPSKMVWCVLPKRRPRPRPASCLELGSAAGRGFQEALFGEVRPLFSGLFGRVQGWGRKAFGV